MNVDLPVPESTEQVFNVILISQGSPVFSKACLDFSTFFLGQEFGAEHVQVSMESGPRHMDDHARFRTIINKEFGEEGNDNGDDAFNNEDPGPTRSASNAA